ncbi:MAG: AMP-binding protein [Novosphingobium sp.]
MAHGARRFASAPAIDFPGVRALRFDEVEVLAGRFAGGLAALGIAPGDHILLHLPNSWQWIVAYHAIARLGCVVVPANILNSPAEVSYMVADAGAKALIAPADRLAAIACPSIVIAVDEAVGATAFDSLLAAEWRAPEEVAPDALFTIGYTSGTTGRPKGAMLTHGNIFASVAMTATAHVRTHADRVYSALPFPHVYGNVVMNCCFLTGAHLTAPVRFDAGEALAAIGERGITLFEGVPTMYYQMLAHPALGEADFGTVSRCTVGGQTIPAAKLEAIVRRFGCPALELWGMTELGGPATTHSPYWPARHGSIGLPFPGMEARIADPDDPGRDAANGRAGELMVRGPLVMQGYWNRSEATAEAIDADGWLATGDVAIRDGDGYLFIVDRKKDMILTAGYNIYPAELEQVIAQHPAVAMAAVAGIPDDEKGEVPVAHIVLLPRVETDAGEILAHCRARLAAYKVPRVIHFVEDLPKTSTGKIMRRELKTQVERTLP